MAYDRKGRPGDRYDGMVGFSACETWDSAKMHRDLQNGRWLLNHRLAPDVIIPLQGVVAHMVIWVDLLLLHKELLQRFGWIYYWQKTVRGKNKTNLS